LCARFRYLARKLALADPEEAFMAGLFRYIGLFVLNKQESKAADFIVKSLKSDHQDMAERFKLIQSLVREQPSRFGYHLIKMEMNNVG
jgi:HD-like signal output (HDOD) protein